MKLMCKLAKEAAALHAKSRAIRTRRPEVRLRSGSLWLTVAETIRAHALNGGPVLLVGLVAAMAVTIRAIGAKAAMAGRAALLDIIQPVEIVTVPAAGRALMIVSCISSVSRSFPPAPGAAGKSKTLRVPVAPVAYSSKTKDPLPGAARARQALKGAEDMEQVAVAADMWVRITTTHHNPYTSVEELEVMALCTSSGLDNQVCYSDSVFIRVNVLMYSTVTYIL